MSKKDEDELTKRPKFIRKADKAKKGKIDFGETYAGRRGHRAVAVEHTGAAERAQMIIDNFMWEYAVLAFDGPPLKFLESKGVPLEIARRYLHAVPVADWHARRRLVQDKTTEAVVKRHVDIVAEMNDRHIAAGKLGMAKAIEFMTKMKIEERRDKGGKLYFSGFKPSDLRALMESIVASQKIHRLALGLNADEGSIQIWQNITNSLNVHGAGINSGESEVKVLESKLTYDEIKALIAAEEKAKREAVDVKVSTG